MAVTSKPAGAVRQDVMRRSSTHAVPLGDGLEDRALAELATLMQDCETLAIRASEVLNGTSQRIAIRWIMSVASFLLARCDMEPPRAQDKRRASTQARATWRPSSATIEGYYLQAATKRARMVYVWGMVQGIIAISALIGGRRRLHGLDVPADAFTTRAPSSSPQPSAAGAVGALISVLLRMDERRTSTFKIDAEIGGRAVRRLGLFRTTVGAILATAVFFALKAGLLQQITIPQGPRAIYFFLVVAFLAGFSERWAQIVLGSAKASSRPCRSSRPPPAPTAHLRTSPVPPGTAPTPPPRRPRRGSVRV